MIVLCLIFAFTYSFSQVSTNENPTSEAPTCAAFIDGSISPTYNGVANAGKGFLYQMTKRKT